MSESLYQKILTVLSSAPNAKSPEAEARLILQHTQDENEALEIAKERLSGEPLQHILGTQYFYDHEYLVNADVLIPRPETEILIHVAIQTLKEKFGDEAFTFAELGLGSGILSTELLAHFPNAKGVASDASAAAIAVAKINLEEILGTHSTNRLTILQTSAVNEGFEIFKSHGPFDLVISNPPYVSRKDEIEAEVFNHEPHSALFPHAAGGVENADFFYENFIEHSASILKEDGLALFEIPHERALTLQTKFVEAGFAEPFLIPDLTDRPRVLFASKN